MKLRDIVERRQPPEPWAEGEKIPWSDPAFSARMLREHLSQEHDAASRRYNVIDRQVAWIHRALLGGRPTRVLDLACGPGLYCSRLARLGQPCVGVDYGPASVAYARAEAEREGLTCTYRQDDIRQAEYGIGYGLVMLLYGEFNVFRPAEARNIVRYYVVDAESGAVQRHASATQAYTDDQCREMLAGCGFDEVAFVDSLEGPEGEAQQGLKVIAAHKRAPPTWEDADGRVQDAGR